MLEALLERDAEVRVKDQDLLEEIDSLRWGAWVLLLQVSPRVWSELFQVLQSLQVSNKAFVALSWRANNCEDDR